MSPYSIASAINYSNSMDLSVQRLLALNPDHEFKDRVKDLQNLLKLTRFVSYRGQNIGWLSTRVTLMIGDGL